MIDIWQADTAPSHQSNISGPSLMCAPNLQHFEAARLSLLTPLEFLASEGGAHTVLNGGC